VALDAMNTGEIIGQISNRTEVVEIPVTLVGLFHVKLNSNAD